MISFVSGRVAALGPDAAVIEVGGIGLSVQCTPNTLAELRVGDRAHLPSTLIVREDSLTLYGFADTDERAVFDLLLTASGIGPRLAQATLAVHDPDSLRRAVATEDFKALCKVPGIGQKGAQRMVLELKDRLGPPRGGPGVPAQAGPVDSRRDQVHSALLNLGWSARDADAALDVAIEDAEPDVSVPVLLRQALRTLGRAT
ncbi:MAG TPA: Holliday junction branch migration protein RuvA [Sporichthyaceae bacterium]|jgi:Holliday junction DNA helicase RuvA